MGNIELLFKLLSSLKMNSVKEIEPVLRSVKFEKDRRNISQQIIDQIITGNEKRYMIYQELRSSNLSADIQTSLATAYFFKHWVPLEHLLNRITQKHSPRTRGAFNVNTLNRMNLLDKDSLNRIVSLRTMRNVLIHNIEIPDANVIMSQGEQAHDLLESLTKQFSSEG